MTTTTHRERLADAIAGRAPDRPPISLWRHFGGIDQSVESLVAATVEFQERHDFDFVKFMPTGTYTIMDWGAETVWEPNPRGIRTVLTLPVRRPRDWDMLQPLDVGKGQLGLVNEALATTIRTLGPDVPVLQTIFSPLATARKLAGPAALAHLRQDPAAFERGMETITALTADLIRVALEAGAGLFYAVQSGSADVLTREEFERWEGAYARRLLEPLHQGVTVLLHSHGDHLWFEEILTWPVSILNWHDRAAGPGLREARKRTPRALAGGLDAWGVLRTGRIEDVRGQVADAVAQVERGLIVTPGCVIPSDSAPHLIQAARDAVDIVPARA